LSSTSKPSQKQERAANTLPQSRSRVYLTLFGGRWQWSLPKQAGREPDPQLCDFHVSAGLLLTRSESGNAHSCWFAKDHGDMLKNKHRACQQTYQKMKMGLI